MSKPTWPSNLPPSGVSTTDGKSIPIEAPAPHKQVTDRSKGRRRQLGEDVLENLANYKKENSSGMTPAGVAAAERDVRVGTMPATRRPRRNMAVFISVDGAEYTFRTHDTKGKELPENRMQMLFVCMRELALGGSILPVFRAFRVKMKDIDGRQFFPFTEESLQAIRLRETGVEVVQDEDEEPRESGSFSLGEDQD